VLSERRRNDYHNRNITTNLLYFILQSSFLPAIILSFQFLHFLPLPPFTALVHHFLLSLPPFTFPSLSFIPFSSPLSFRGRAVVDKLCCRLWSSSAMPRIRSSQTATITSWQARRQLSTAGGVQIGSVTEASRTTR